MMTLAIATHCFVVLVHVAIPRTVIVMIGTRSDLRLAHPGGVRGHPPKPDCSDRSPQLVATWRAETRHPNP